MYTKEIFEKSALFGNTLRHGFHFKLNSIFNVWGCSGRFHMNNTNTSISKAQAFLLSFEIGGSLDVSDVEGDLHFNFPMPSEGKWLNAISYTHVQNKKNQIPYQSKNFETGRSNRPTWKCTILGRISIEMQTVLRRFQIVFDRFRIDLNFGKTVRFGYNFGIDLWSVWDRFGIDLESIWKLT